MTGAGTAPPAAVAASSEQTQLGQGVRWDDRRFELLRVDILAHRFYRDQIRGDGSLVPVTTYRLPWPVGVVAPVKGEGGWLLGAGRGIVHLQPDGTYRVVHTEVAPPRSRMNDGGCDPHGRFWVGAVADDHRRGGGSLYRLSRDGQVDQVLDDLAIPNGIVWTEDGTTMYLADGGVGVVYAFTFSAADGSLSDQREHISVPPDIGVPDGMTIDASGDLWVAIWGGGRVHRYAPDGTLRDVVPIPAQQTTCCAFAGAAQNLLYVTTATEGWTDEERQSDPAAGLVYLVSPGAGGRSTAPFAPEPAWWATVPGAVGAAIVEGAA